MYSFEYDSLEEAITTLEIAEDPQADHKINHPEYDVVCSLVIGEETYVVEICIYGEE